MSNVLLTVSANVDAIQPQAFSISFHSGIKYNYLIIKEAPSKDFFAKLSYFKALHRKIKIKSGISL